MQPGNYVKDDVLRSIVVVVTNAPELHGYSVRSFYRAMLEWRGQVFFLLKFLQCVMTDLIFKIL